MKKLVKKYYCFAILKLKKINFTVKATIFFYFIFLERRRY